MIRFTITFLCLFLISFVNSLEESKETKTKRPNIVIILGDDIGWNDVSFHGSNEILTPNIDALGYNGVILNRFYTQSSCTPSRSALLTGYYPIRAGLQGLPLNDAQNYSLPIRFTLLPEKLKGLGYSTSLIGKWHLGFLNSSVTPLERGFDHHFGYWNGFMTYYTHTTTTKNMTGFSLRDGKRAAFEYEGKYATDLFTEKAIDVINESDEDSPFFLFISHLAAHSNGTITEPKDIDKADKRFSYIDNKERRYFADAMTNFDNSVGDVVEALSNKGILENTIILLFMDNGAEITGYYPNGGSNWPLRGQKLTLFEGGVRGTAVFYTSKLTKRNIINDQLIHITDLFPTLYAAAGGKVENLGPIDGVNQWKTLTENTPSARTELLVNIDEQNSTSGIISHSGRYKLVNGTFGTAALDGYSGSSGRNIHDFNNIYKTTVLKSKTNCVFKRLYHKDSLLTGTTIEKLRTKLNLETCRTVHSEKVNNCKGICLFDLFSDPCETTDVKKDHPEILKELKSRLGYFWNQVNPIPKRFIDYNSNPENCNNAWFPWLDPNYQVYC